jgi:hypothetical protein
LKKENKNMKDYKKFINEDKSNYGNYNFPLTTINSLMNYYTCSNCNAMYKEFNEPVKDKCRYCDEETITSIDSDDWYDELINRGSIDDDEIDIVRKEQENEYKPISLVELGKLKDRADKRKRIN